MEFLKKLGIEQENYGASSGPGHWSKTIDSGKIESKNPTNGEVIASVYQCSLDDYNEIVNISLEAFFHVGSCGGKWAPISPAAMAP